MIAMFRGARHVETPRPGHPHADTGAASFLFASGLPLLGIEAHDPRAMFVFLDKQARGALLRAAFAHDAPIAAQALLRARHQLVRGVRLARESPVRCLTGSELAQHFADAVAARRQHRLLLGIPEVTA